MISHEDKVLILGLESSCDDTSCAVLLNGKMLANIAAAQKIHEQYGGVVPELAGRSHQQNIVPVVDAALKEAGVNISEINAIAFTRGPGLMGSLLVGVSFAKSLSLALNIPLIEVNHMQAHILAHFILSPFDGAQGDKIKLQPKFPFLCLTVSGGHTQLVRVADPYTFELLGETIDDAAGEAFDKGAKILGLPYPGGPLIDKYAKEGNPEKFKFSKPKVPDLNFSYSGLKTSLLYFVRDHVKENENFVTENLNDLCASYQKTIIDILIEKLISAAEQTGIKEIAIAGGVSANSALRSAIEKTGKEKGWNVFIPEFQFCTDNAAMIAMAGYFKYLRKDFCGLDVAPLARWGVEKGI
ncbi:MAG: tRNA (adenosine(37)-N6)-threonylcarbamoyltransferase complex transferase subunit TsaD [Bacteroidia bacterium]|nr:tRNA (adenosine(37)-N6)-threonylcarbamoyltransferase complex transferase subunit TsaD [Bacteroidia bacterium]